MERNFLEWLELLVWEAGKDDTMFTGSISTIIKERQVNKANALVNDLLSLVKKQVLVGVPGETNPRWLIDGKGKSKVKKPSAIGNATLAFIHDQGSPLQKIPARPFMQTGIKNCQDKILPEFMAIALAQLDVKKDQIDRRLNRIGLIAQSSIRNAITQGEGWPPLKRGTLLGRLRKRKALRRMPKERREEIMGSLRPLIDTGQLRSSISYVVRSR